MVDERSIGDLLTSTPKLSLFAGAAVSADVDAVADDGTEAGVTFLKMSSGRRAVPGTGADTDFSTTGTNVRGFDDDDEDGPDCCLLFSLACAEGTNGAASIGAGVVDADD